jgi:hypothetical protein
MFFFRFAQLPFSVTNTILNAPIDNTTGVNELLSQISHTFLYFNIMRIKLNTRKTITKNNLYWLKTFNFSCVKVSFNVN